MIRRIIALVFTTVALYILGFGIFLYNLPQQNKSIDVTNEDAIVVFTGGTGRLYTAKKLMKRNFNGPILISGVNERVHPTDVLGDSATTYIGHITYDYESPSTRGNVSMTSEWVSEKGISSILLVTSYYHVPRSLLLFEQAKFDKPITVYPVFPRTIGAFFLMREYTEDLLAFARII